MTTLAQDRSTLETAKFDVVVLDRMLRAGDGLSFIEDVHVSRLRYKLDAGFSSPMAAYGSRGGLSPCGRSVVSVVRRYLR